MWDKQHQAKIEVEIKMIDQLFVAYRDVLAKVQHTIPDLVEMTALASILHSFYNGLESIFLIIAKEVDQVTPSGARWHRELLHQMVQTTEQKEPFLSTELVKALDEYLSFRHFFRHSYSLLYGMGKIISFGIECSINVGTNEVKHLTFHSEYGC